MKTGSSQGRPELLAPAGSLEALFAASDHGADAIYLGLQSFSARAKAQNFSEDDLPRLSRYLHGRGQKLYLALNTLIKEHELPQLVEILAAANSAGVDAIILQDLAVWRLAREFFPGVELHASTQLTIHNLAGCRMLESMGFTRVVLARELSLEQIAHIHAGTSIELEHFVHGAHCYSFSGQCYFSSFLGGQSGNRGRCTQPCRRRYRSGQRQGYYFSPNDLSAIDLIPELTAAGVRCLKIEGRMKSAEYVARVVEAYRLVIDAADRDRPAAVQEAKELLKNSFGRQPTSGFLPGGEPKNLVAPHTLGATGRYLGQIERLQKGVMTLRARAPLELGDRVRIQPATDQPGTAFSIRRLDLGTKRVQQSVEGESVGIHLPPDVQPAIGDSVFKVASGQHRQVDLNALRKRLDTVEEVKQPIRLHFSLPEAGELVVRIEADPLNRQYRFPVDTFPAERQPLSGDTLAKVFGQTGGTPFLLAGWSADPLPPVVIPPSRLKAVRRELYQLLGEQLPESASPRPANPGAALASLLPANPPAKREPPQLTVVSRNTRSLGMLKESQVTRLVLPFSEETVTQALASKRLQGSAPHVCWDLPIIVFDDQWNALTTQIEHLMGAGFRSFRVHNLGQLRLFGAHPDAKLTGSYRLYLLNSQSALAWKEIGLAEGTCYLEDDRDNLADLAQRNTGLPLNVTVFAQVPLLISRMPLVGLRSGDHLASDRDEPLQIERHGEVSTLLAGRRFSLTGHLADLSKIGLTHWVIDLGDVESTSREGRHIMEAIQQDRSIAGCTHFNFGLGLA